MFSIALDDLLRAAVPAFWLLAAGSAQAQPGNASPENYGDRQAGRFGDPGSGYFGNAGAGNFDSNGIKTPPPGVKPLGQVYEPRSRGAAPYITLPEPPKEPAAPPQGAAAEKKKPANGRASSKPAKKPQ